MSGHIRTDVESAGSSWGVECGGHSAATVMSDASFSSDNNCLVLAGPWLFPAGPLVLKADGAACVSHWQRVLKGI